MDWLNRIAEFELELKSVKAQPYTIKEYEAPYKKFVADILAHERQAVDKAYVAGYNDGLHKLPPQHGTIEEINGKPAELQSKEERDD